MAAVGLALWVIGCAFVAADEPARKQEEDVADSRAALAAWQNYIGAWRGAGQPRRGSNRGAWTEAADWAWDFADARPTVLFNSPDAKFFALGHITPGERQGTFVLVAARPGGQGQERFVGSRQAEAEGEAIVFDRQAAKDEAAADPQRPARITFRLVASNNRMLVLYEARTAAAGYARLAEVGYTRQGIQFAAGGGGPECVVTGGLGTIAVKYQGQTYYVCCSGCKELFEADPAAAIAEYRERLAKRREKTGK